MQAALVTTTTATPIDRSTLALQFTIKSCLPVAADVLQQQIKLQAGLTQSSPSGPKPPFTIPPDASLLSFLTVNVEADVAASTASQLVSSTCLRYTLAAGALAVLPTVSLDPSGRARQSTSDSSTRPAPQRIPEAALKELLLGYDGLEGPLDAPVDPLTEGGGMAPAQEGGERAALASGSPDAATRCMYTHFLVLELSSFTAMALLRQTASNGSLQENHLAAPSITFMGPSRLVARQDVSLIWRIQWPSSSENMLGVSSVHRYPLAPPPKKKIKSFQRASLHGTMWRYILQQYRYCASSELSVQWTMCFRVRPVCPTNSCIRLLIFPNLLQQA
jgi:hypothetical protein